jgi:hypothetical protein
LWQFSYSSDFVVTVVVTVVRVGRGESLSVSAVGQVCKYSARIHHLNMKSAIEKYFGQ